jgi:cyclohexyl-isocyanide hydratase
MHIGILVFPRLTQLDASGPYEVFSRMPGAEVHLVAKATTPIVTEFGLTVTPTKTFQDAPPLEVICIPGGAGINPLLNDDETLAYVRKCAESARYVTSVCTGALLLGAAGLLDGYRATTHWLSHELLREFGATPTNERIVVDRNRITGGGVTAGIDFALMVAAMLHGPNLAREIQLMIEYAPDPPFDAGSPDGAPRAIVERIREQRKAAQEVRARLVHEAALKLKTKG